MIPRLLVFDLDGTLIDSSVDLCHAVNAALNHVGKPPLPNDVVASYIGDGAAMLVRRSLGDLGDLESRQSAEQGQPEIFHRAYEFFLEFYRAHKLDNTRTYPGVLPSLHRIRSLRPDLPMAVLTNKPVRPSREICEALDLAPFFFANYGGNSFASKKPDPEGLLTLIAEAQQLLRNQSLGNSPELSASQVVMIGDSDVDVLTARRCGAVALGCRYGLAPEALASARPDLWADQPEDWVPALGLA